MAKEQMPEIESEVPDTAGDRRLHGLSPGPIRESADHNPVTEFGNPDTELRLDGESDELYQDGLSIGEDERDTLAGTGSGS